MRAFKVTDRDEFNERCRAIFLTAMSKYGVTPTEWANANGRSAASINNWVCGRKQAAMGFLLDLMTAVGCVLTLTPPEEWKAPRQRKPRQRMWPI